VRINALVAMAQKVPEDGWTMQDGTPWPGNNVRDHPGMIQVSTILRCYFWSFLWIENVVSTWHVCMTSTVITGFPWSKWCS